MTVKQLYEGVPAQTALSVALGDKEQGYRALYDICKINDEGLGRMPPGCNRGREKAAIIALQKPGHIIQQYVHLRQKAIWGGNLHAIVEAVLEAITDIVNKAADPSCLEIDIVVVWMGNELCGRRGVFLDPGTPQWQIGPGVIAHRIRVTSADFMFAKLLPESRGDLMRKYPYDENAMSRHLKRQAEIKEAQQECPDPWENNYIPPPDEPVTAMKAVPEYILEWERVRARLEEAKKWVIEQADRPKKQQIYQAPYRPRVRRHQL
eukprot:s2062_g18.t1